MKKSDILFEVSWEVCNKVGGINTVVSTKAKFLQDYTSELIMIGPDIWREHQAVSDFIKDDNLFSKWQHKAASEGLKVTVGRWNIPSKPIAILIDFTDFFSEKNSIFKEFWEEFQLDSLSGDWNYIEPAIFGYAAAKVIKSFHSFHYDLTSKTIAHFHEWMTGTGVLYLKKNAPYIASVFTTHATLLGRTIAGNKMPFYGQLEKYNPELQARKLGLPSQYSLEKTAAQNADIFTTVSSITAEECKYLLKREVDFITTNGFNKSFVPPENDFEEKRIEAKNTLKSVAEACTNTAISEDAFYVLNSGRYEFSNKGVDIFIDALNEINKANPEKEIVAFIMMPGNHSGPDKRVLDRLKSKSENAEVLFTTHNLVDYSNDPVIKRLKSSELDNSKNSKVKIIFSPVYLNKKDGIYNLSYYDLLIGFDLSVFPSYYEPWGYTPMESLAFAVPTITSDLAGFGHWLADKSEKYTGAFKIINRYHKEESSVEQLKEAILSFSEGEINIENARRNAIDLSNLCLWDNMIENYYDAYTKALEISESRISEMDLRPFENKGLKFAEIGTNEPKWKKIYVKQQLSEKLQPMQEIASNLWWTWNHEAAMIFKSIDPQLWIDKKHNPIALIESLNTKQLNALENNSEFTERLYSVYNQFTEYMKAKPADNKESIAYFSMEFGIHDTIKIFSGGLGILAGDYLKEASDSNVNIKAVGLLYRFGYFKQRITALGDQISEFNAQKFTQLPLKPVRDENGDWVKIKLVLPTRTIYAKAWKLAVGRIDLYLLDTDIEENTAEDRKITYQLYGGNSENRFLQELVLGVGGIRLLKQLDINSVHYHCNEGHAALIGVERLNQYIKKEGLDFHTALELVRSSSLFTTHTPVPAGHDRFEEDIIRKYIPHYPGRLQLSWNEFMALGRVNEYDYSEKFNMSNLAAKLSRNMNGVSKLHSEVSRKMFNDLYPGYYSDELHIDYVTNGVHLPTWLAKKWFELFQERLSPDFFTNQDKTELWEKIYDIEPEKIWELRNHSRKKLIDYVKGRIKIEMTVRRESPQYLTNALYGLRDDVLTIGFARRFATYKRAYLLFKDLDRLNSIINDEDKPVQFLFAGKAHPADQAGKDLIKRIVEITKMPQFTGKVIFLEDYDIALGKRLVQGVDVWLNNPARPMEASGTSGEKATMNAVLNLSVLDGWWAEGYTAGAGWALSKEKDYDSQDLQDALDASNLYYIIQEDIKSVFYNRDNNNIPNDWVNMLKNNLVKIAPRFTMNRMLSDYVNKFYNQQISDFKKLEENNFEKAKGLSNWKEKVRENWDAIEVIKISHNHSSSKALKMGEAFELSVSLLLADLNPEDIGVEVVFGNKEGDVIQKIIGKNQLELKSFNAKRAIYAIKLPLSNAGVYDFSFRVYPKHKLLSHRMEFPYVKWI